MIKNVLASVLASVLFICVLCSCARITESADDEGAADTGHSIEAADTADTGTAGNSVPTAAATTVPMPVTTVPVAVASVTTVTNAVTADISGRSPEVTPASRPDGQGNPSPDPPNPYSAAHEVHDYWRYYIFEIFRDTETVPFEDTLDYQRDYSHIITYPPEKNWEDQLHEYQCKITLPQGAGNNPWDERINAYYKDLMPELIAEGDKLWYERIDDWYTQYLIYHYEAAYRHENVLTVVRGREYVGWRPSIGQRPVTDLFSAIDGQRLCLDDLFCADRDEYLPALLELPAEELDYDMYNDMIPHDHIYEPWETRASVAVTPKGLVFIYPTGAISSNAAGIIFLRVLYEDLYGLLNPVYFG